MLPKKHLLTSLLHLGLYAGLLGGAGGDVAEARRHSTSKQTAKSGSDEERAQELLRTGLAALAAKDFSAAEAALAQSYRLQPAPEVLYQLARVADGQGRLLSAQDLMRRYLADPNLESGEDSEEQKEAARIRALKRPPHGRLNILGKRGTWVSLDGHLVGMLPIARPLLVTPGDHKLLLESGGKQHEEPVQLPAGRFAELRYIQASDAVLMSVWPTVLLIDESVGLAPPLPSDIERTIDAALLGEHCSILPASDALSVANLPALKACLQTTDCQVQLAQKLEAEYVLRVRAAQEGAAAWRFELSAIDTGVGEVGAQKQGRCAGCSTQQLEAALTEATSAVLTAVQRRPRGTLQIESTPAGGEVRSGDRVLGRTPYQGPAWVGPRELSISLPGFDSQQAQVVVRDGQVATLRVNLVPAAAEPEPAPLVQTSQTSSSQVLTRPARPRWRLALGGVLGGGALVTLGFGAAALAVSGGCVETPQQTAVVCRQFHDTSALGGGLIGTGALLGAASVLLIALPERARPTQRAVAPR